MTETARTVDVATRRSTRRVAVALMLIALSVAVVALRLAPSPVHAQSAAVTIKDFRYTPSEIKVKVGDSVTWTNAEGKKQSHTVIQDDGAFSSDGNRKNDPDAEIKPGSFYTITFDKDNATYPYHCRLHAYMKGRVIVGKGSPPGAVPPPPTTDDPEPDTTPQPGPQLPPWAPPLPGRSLPVRTVRVAPDAQPADAQAPYEPTELPQGVSGPGTLGDGTRLARYTTDKDGVKEFHLRMAPITWTTSPGNTQTAYAFNGTIPGPVIRVNEGDKLRIVVTNALPVPTSVHWHGMILPNDQDGVPGITQPLIQPGGIFTYTWTAVATGTHWYHTHTSGKDEGLGLYGALEVKPHQGDFPADRDYRVMIGDTNLGLVLNGREFPYTYPLKAKVGERVHIRLIDTGDQVHPIHIHGFPFQLVARDGIRLAVPEWMDTTLIGTGQTLDLIWQPMSPGNWLFHCHIFAHSHDESGMIGLVTAFEVAPADGPMPGGPPPLPALPTPKAVPGYDAAPVPLPPSGTTLLPSVPAAAPVQPQSGGLLGRNENAVLIAVGLLLAYRLGGRFGHPRRNR